MVPKGRNCPSASEIGQVLPYYLAPPIRASTLIRNLASSVAPHALTAIVDSDVGQSSVGPPACVGACLVKGALKSQTKAEMLHFVGNFSPQGHFLPLLSGLVRLLG